MADIVQCDELRPRCRKCLLFGVECDYGGGTKTLQLAGQEAFQLDFAPVSSAEQVIDFSTAPPVSKNQNVEPTQDIGTISSIINPSSFNRPSGAASQPWSHRSTPYTPVSMTSTIVTMIDNSMQLDFSASDMLPTTGSAFISPVSFWHFSEAHLEILARFRDRTALSIGDKSLAPAYRDVLCQLAMTVCRNHAYIQQSEHLIDSRVAPHVFFKRASS